MSNQGALRRGLWPESAGARVLAGQAKRIRAVCKPNEPERAAFERTRNPENLGAVKSKRTRARRHPNEAERCEIQAPRAR
jgi:hypothetical protein